MSATMRPLTTQHPKIEQFLRLWHENGRAQFQRAMPSHNYDSRQRKIAKDRGQYILLNSCTLALAEILSADQIVEQGMQSRVEEAMGIRTRVVAAAVATLQALGITERQLQDLVDAHVKNAPNDFGDLFTFSRPLAGVSGAEL
jgi:hypothetical protein